MSSSHREKGFTLDSAGGFGGNAPIDKLSAIRYIDDLNHPENFPTMISQLIKWEIPLYDFLMW